MKVYNIFVSSTIYHVGVILLTVVFSLVGIIILPLARKVRYRIIRNWAKFTLSWLNFTCKLSWEVDGVENIPKNSGIVFAKHQSAWETLALQLVFPEQSQVIKRELLLVPFFGWGLASLNPISINRSDGIKALKKVLQESKVRIKRGWWIIIFPEGTRTNIGEKGNYSRTAAAVAKANDCPIIPVAHNAGLFWPKASYLRYPGKIVMKVGPKVITKDKSNDEITKEASKWIETTCMSLPSTRQSS